MCLIRFIQEIYILGIEGELEKMVKVSVIIPVYNVEKYIRETLDSMVNQTLKDIEIICVDDCSTDDSLKIIEEYAKFDSRVKVIEYKENKSSSQARKDGVMKSNSEYIMFLDGDDYLELNACEELYEIISNEEVDMVQFGTHIWNEGDADSGRISRLETFMKPYTSKLYDREVFKACFFDNKYRFSIWNKIYSADLCKNAFKDIKDGNFPKAQDLYAFYVISAHAMSYYGVTDKYYNYRFGAGVTGRGEIDLPHFETFCKSVWVAEAVAEFANARGDEDFLKAAEHIRVSLLNDCMGNWYNYLQEDYAKDGFDLLNKYWGNDEVVARLCSQYFLQKKEIVKKVFGAKSLEPDRSKNIRTIGIFYQRYALGGVQRVISLLIPMYISMGYKIVLFTDEYDEQNEYSLPEEVTRVILPNSLKIKRTEYKERAQEFKTSLVENKVDIMLYHAASSQMLLFDMLLIKTQQIPFVLTVHEVAFASMLHMNRKIVDNALVYRIADKVTVLTKMEEKIWRSFNINATYVPNPMDVSIVDRKQEYVEKDTILWIGRLETWQKRFMDTVDIMREIVRKRPDAKMFIVGNDVSKDATKNLLKRIEEFGLEENMILCGYSSDVDEYYRKASVHISTATWESFGMTIVESKSYGIPLVTYELPFLEILETSKGFIAVDQGDTKAMGKAVATLLEDKELYEKMSKEAKESVMPLMSIDLCEIWRGIIDGISIKPDRKIIIPDNEDFSIVMKMLLALYENGHEKLTELQNKTKKAETNTKNRLKRVEAEAKKIEVNMKNKLKKSEEKLKKTRKSYTFRIGKFIMFIPRKIFGIFKKGKK